MQEKNTENTEISERISQMIDFLEINKNEFARKLNYDRSQTIYDITKGKSAPSFDFFQRFYDSEFSEIINPIWLFTGKGNMLRDSINNDIDTVQLTIELKKEKKDQVLKLIFGDNNLEIINK